jgi:hypothetical protein
MLPPSIRSPLTTGDSPLASPRTPFVDCADQSLAAELSEIP